MGGGNDLDEAFRWLCRKANGGDFLILRARGDDDYNSYINGMCKLNSVATLIIPDRDCGPRSRGGEIIRHAEAVFIAGGDQSRYVNSGRARRCRMPSMRISRAASPSAAPAPGSPCWASSPMAV